MENNELYIKLKKLDERAVIPSYAHEGDVGMDMTAISVEYDDEHDVYNYHTGLAFESNFNVGQFLFPRSSNRKTDAYLTNSVGIADSAIYRGEIIFAYKNRTSFSTLACQESIMEALTNAYDFKSFKELFREYWQENWMKKRKKIKALEFAPYKVGDRIGQMVFMEYPTVHIEVVDELSETERGANGFGSSGN